MRFSLKAGAARLVVLAAAVCGIMALDARAGENGYVLRLARDAYVCASPFLADYTVTGEKKEILFSGDNFGEIYHLTAGEGGDQGVSIAAYCADAAAEIPGSSGYCRTGLEDSGYYSSETAGRLRAVVQWSYPHRDTASIQAGANLWLQSHGLPELRKLQSGEAVLASQLAIWEVTRGERFAVNHFLSGWEDMSTPGWRKYLEKAADPDVACQQATEDSAWNIEGLYRYLCSLKPAAPGCETVSDAALQNPVYTAEKEPDGSYTVTVGVDIRTTVGNQDALKLRIECGGQAQTQSVAEPGSYSACFSGLPDRPEAVLEITGTQHGGDVYLFESENCRLLGFDDSVLPVHGRLLVKPDCILEILQQGENGGPLPANVRFDLYRAATWEELEKGEFSLRVLSEPEALKKYRTPERLVTILTTDTHGRASYNFTANGQPEGIYLVTQRAGDRFAPFLLMVPGVSADGGKAYTLSVTPTGEEETCPDAAVNVGQIGCSSGSFDIGQSHTWILRGSIPVRFAAAQKYTLSCSVDKHLLPGTEAPTVTLLTRAGTEKTLAADKHYILTGDEEREIGISLTPAGIAYTAANLEEGTYSPELRVGFQAAIRENAGLGVPISCSATLDYLNSAGVFYEAQSVSGEVHTGGIHLLVTDEEGTPLAGGVFRLARPAEETDDEWDVLNVGGTDVNVVFAEFLTEGGEGRVPEVTTGNDGTAFLRGLAYGRYYLVQTKAAEGVSRTRQPVIVSVNASSHLTARDGWQDGRGRIVDNTVRIVNTEDKSPETGDMGVVALIVAGSILIGMVCAVLFEATLRAAKRRVRR